MTELLADWSGDPWQSKIVELRITSNHRFNFGTQGIVTVASRIEKCSSLIGETEITEFTRKALDIYRRLPGSIGTAGPLEDLARIRQLYQR